MIWRNHRMILIPAAMMFAGAVLSVSCSPILEDRSDCPCILTVNTAEISQTTGIISPVQEGGLRINLLNEEGKTIIADKAVKSMDRRGEEEYSTKVERSISVLSSSIGGKHYRILPERRMMVLEKGNEADSLFVHHSVVDCTGETAYDTLKVHKEWCTVTIHLAGNDPRKRYSFDMSGEWNGFMMESIPVPCKGDFRCNTRKLSDGSFQARIPRQGDDSLLLGFYEDDSMGIHSREIASFPLGNLIVRAGFDWYRRDLHDIDITIDSSSLELGIEICPWYGGINMGDLEL